MSNYDDLAHIGPGTPMGGLLRQYWLPACLSNELEQGGAPMRLLLLGERLVAFRDGEGRVGIMDHKCPHRGASLFFGRVEQTGIRCVYHGWRFDAQGHCTDIPNVDVPQSFVSTISAGGYPTRERNGVVWIYMGVRRDNPPELPQIEALLLDEAQVSVRCLQRNYNWLQGLEGDIDTSHFGFLHLGSVDPRAVSEDSMHRFTVTDRAPKYHVTNTPWGTMYCAYRPAQAQELYYRFAHFIFPCWTLFPDGDFNDHVVASAWVPMDDEHTMVFSFFYKDRAMPLRHLKEGSAIPGLEPDAAGRPNPPTKPNTTGWYGRWRTLDDEENDYGIDRGSQRNGSYTGITGVVMQDLAIIESMGAITERAKEHLVASDAMVARTRRALLAAARGFQDEGTPPPLVDQPWMTLAARSGSFIASGARSWGDAYTEQARKACSPAATLKSGVDRYVQTVGPIGREA